MIQATMRIPALAIVISTLTCVQLAHAQARPDFSGEWTRVDSTEQRSVAAVGDASFRVGNMGNGWGSPLTLRQQGAALVVEFAHFGTYDLQPRLRYVYALDGTESRNAIMIGHAESVLRSRTTWRDSTLVITTIYLGPERGTTEVTQSLTLASPTSLLMETTRSGVAGSRPTVIRATYAKR